MVFSLSLVGPAERSLLDLFILLNTPARFVEDLDFFGPAAGSRLFLEGDFNVIRLEFVVEVASRSCGLGDDCVLPCLSPRTLLLAA